ncbi:WhiB family transcriptional regulator [Streptomyces sp. NPDC056159]|uniref:WhiB family transcriptional regulator n=1 Tax=Streptomyces sp. NPDC056159 TaxID=3155537 RepID=UPI003435DDAC
MTGTSDQTPPRRSECTLTHPCAANPELWFSEDAAGIAEAKAACGPCPSRVECAEEGEYEPHGVWGGRSPEDRAEVRRARVILREEMITMKINSMQGRGLSISAMAREVGLPRKTLADRLRKMTGLAA